MNSDPLLAKVNNYFMVDPLYKPEYHINRVKAKILSRWRKTSARKRVMGDVVFDFDFGFSPRYYDYYYGVGGLDVIRSLKKHLQSGDTYLDVGANIGYTTAIGAGLVGKNGNSHAFEPVEKCYEKLKNLADSNPQYKIVVNNVAVGDENRMLKFYEVDDNENIFLSTFIENQIDCKSHPIDVPMVKLSDYIKNNDIDHVDVIKIDVEGYEYPVLMGLKEYLDKGHSPIILSEISPKAYGQMGWNLRKLSDFMGRYSYRAFHPLNEKIEIKLSALSEITNVIFKKIYCIVTAPIIGLAYLFDALEISEGSEFICLTLFL